MTLKTGENSSCWVRLHVIPVGGEIRLLKPLEMGMEGEFMVDSKDSTVKAVHLAVRKLS